MKAYLLYPDGDFDFEAGLPAGHEDLIQDLELAAVLDAMAAGDKFLAEVATKVLLTCLHDPETIRYRQQVLADCLARSAVIRDMYAVATGVLEDRRHLWWGGYGGTYQNAVVQPVWCGQPPGSLRNPAAAVAADRRRARGDEFRSDGMRRLFATLHRELDDEYFEEISNHLKQLRFRAGVLISAELDRDNSGIGFALRDPGLPRRRWTERLGIGPRLAYSFTVSPRDKAGGQILADLTSRGINLVANAAAQSADHIGSYFTMLRAELGFYVSCLNLAGRLAAKGAPVTFPDPAQASPPVFSCTDLRDASLELQSPAPVTGNDVQADGKSLIIITGANSGGKSTFLRSAGVAQLMMQCGLFVTAQSYQANVTRGIFTHFIRGEDATMTSGRLDDELKRMSGIAAQIRPHSLMLFNESFAGTNEREGTEIGYQIVRALLDAGIKVFFVTHRFGLADRFHQQHAARHPVPQGRALARRAPQLQARGEGSPPDQLRGRPLLPARRLAGGGQRSGLLSSTRAYMTMLSGQGAHRRRRPCFQLRTMATISSMAISVRSAGCWWPGIDPRTRSRRCAWRPRSLQAVRGMSLRSPSSHLHHLGKRETTGPVQPRPSTPATHSNSRGTLCQPGLFR